VCILSSYSHQHCFDGTALLHSQDHSRRGQLFYLASFLCRLSAVPQLVFRIREVVGSCCTVGLAAPPGRSPRQVQVPYGKFTRLQSQMQPPANKSAVLNASYSIKLLACLQPTLSLSLFCRQLKATAFRPAGQSECSQCCVNAIGTRHNSHNLANLQCQVSVRFENSLVGSQFCLPAMQVAVIRCIELSGRAFQGMA